MKKVISILFLLSLPIFSFAQISKFKGGYRAVFFSFPGGKQAESSFEVKEDGIINGTLAIGANGETILPDLQGKTTDKGKFQAQIIQTDGTVLLIRGNLPDDQGKGTISFIQRKIVKSPGSKSVLESGITGFIERAPIPAAEVKIEDTGSTYLIFGNTNLLFPKEWSGAAAKISESSYQNKTFKVIEIKDESADSIRHFRMALANEPDKKIWRAEEGFVASYRETKGTEKTHYIYKELGKIEYISENDREIILKITNLQLKKSPGEEIVRIDGYIHVMK